tara:strand:+ start:760 stop:1215 length:456 start_codon:yes stop_codon:yes gene_type:complete
MTAILYLNHSLTASSRYPRVAGWEANLIKTIEIYRHEPFAWATNDCFTFAVRCEEAVCGKTRFPELYKAEYINQFGSMRAFMREGYYGMIDCMDQRLDEIDMRVARRGDWSVVGTPDGLAVGVLTGDKIAVTGEQGLLFFDYAQGVKAWRI